MIDLLPQQRQRRFEIETIGLLGDPLHAIPSSGIQGGLGSPELLQQRIVAPKASGFCHLIVFRGNK